MVQLFLCRNQTRVYHCGQLHTPVIIVRKYFRSEAHKKLSELHQIMVQFFYVEIVSLRKLPYTYNNREGVILIRST